MVQLCRALVDSNETAHAQRHERVDARLTELGEAVRRLDATAVRSPSAHATPCFAYRFEIERDPCNCILLAT
jgi:hypothetical protein